MRILYFAQARLATGRSEESFSSSMSMTEEAIWKRLTQMYPSLIALQPFCRIAKNGSFLQPGELLDPQDEVAVLPPVSGG
ncbi:MoaD/ThiS family protein [bacterium]|nr:MoaD/ThiS family protein [bacterium]